MRTTNQDATPAFAVSVFDAVRAGIHMNVGGWS